MVNRLVPEPGLFLLRLSSESPRHFSKDELLVSEDRCWRSPPCAKLPQTPRCGYLTAADRNWRNPELAGTQITVSICFPHQVSQHRATDGGVFSVYFDLPALVIFVYFHASSYLHFSIKLVNFHPPLVLLSFCL